jgi:hypothetical protein
MTLLILGTGVIVVVVMGLVLVAVAAKQFHQWDDPPIKHKREHWR